MQEEWRDIEGFEGVYQVSNYGRVRNIKFLNSKRSFKKERILSPKIDRYGYLLVHLSKGSKDYHWSIHRMVAKAFLPNPDNLPQVNHKDENKTNNHVSNLEWCTNNYNIHYGTALERSAKGKKIPLLQISPTTGEIIKQWDGAVDASMHLFGNKDKKRLISSCAKHEGRGRNTAYGYVWEYGCLLEYDEEGCVINGH